MPTSTRREAALTLIELMIALLISTVGAVAVFTLFLGQSRAMRQSQETMEVHDNVRIALDMIGRDLRSSGFMLPDGMALRVENNCGNSPTGGGNYSGVDVASLTLTAPGGAGSAVTVNGDIRGTTQDDGCPNGSDRLAIYYRPRTDFIANAPLNNGNNPLITWPCPGQDCSLPFARSGVTGTSCGTSDFSDPIQICVNEDPYRCFDVVVQPQGNLCECLEASNQCVIQVNDADTMDPFQSGSPGWDDLCLVAGCSPPEAKQGSSFQSFASRTYQIMDLDLDGSTELVVSDDQSTLWVKPGSPEEAHFDVVANYIDDLQVSVAFRNTPDTFEDVSLWNFQNCNEDTDNACLWPRTAPGTFSNPPVAVRVSIIARSAKRRVAPSGTVDPSGRLRLHDNDPPYVPYDPDTIPTGAALCYGSADCGCGTRTAPPIGITDYMRCTQNGNAQGYARRVVTEVIALRNLAF